MNAFVPRAMCPRCERPESVCLCPHVHRIENRTRVVILQHPREAWVPIGTARLAELALDNAERHVGIEFASHQHVRAALSNPAAPAVLLSPGPDALDLAVQPPRGPVTLAVLDGTWWQASKLLKRNPWLSALPRYAIRPATPSRYRIRREPMADCMSTIEAIALALAILEPTTPVDRLLAPFDALVSQQLAFIARGQTRHVKKQSRARQIVPLLPAERARDLIVGYGEANAWPRGTPLGDSPEIVHWVAERVLTGERFEAFVRPHHPVSPSFSFHTDLAVERVIAGETPSEFRRRWASFVRPGDVLGGWGYYASQILLDGGARIPERLDLRVAAIGRLRRRPGEMHDCAIAFGRPPEPPWAAGRAGRRLSALVAVARALLGE